jgi:hypothetical protein
MKKRGRAGRRMLAGLHGLVPKNRKTREIAPQLPVRPGIPRAMFEACSARTPVDVPGLPFGKGPSIHRWRVSSPARSCWDTESARPGDPCGARQARRATCGLGRRKARSVAHPGHRRPAPPCRTLLESAPPSSRVDRNIISIFKKSSNMFRGR